MNENQKRTMLIHFKDGSTKLLEFPAPAPGGNSSLTARINEALDARHLVLEAEGALFVIPVESIKYLQSFPAPEELPGYAIKGVRFKG